MQNINSQPPASSLQPLVIVRPDDWHVHLRDGEMLKAVLPYTARAFGRAIVMPNLKPPVTATAQAKAYREQILAAVPAGIDFTPLMTLYLTDSTDPDDVARGHAEGIVTAVKFYPAHATTNSEHGITDIKKAYPVFEKMQRIKMPLLVHGEVTDPAIDILTAKPCLSTGSCNPCARIFLNSRSFLNILQRRKPLHMLRRRDKGAAGGDDHAASFAHQS